MEQEKDIINWLLEDENPEVKLRTLRELFGYGKEHPEVLRTRENLIRSPIYNHAMVLLQGEKKWGKYDALISFAEWGLTREDIDIDEQVFLLIGDTDFKMLCGEGLLLRNLVKLGYYKEKIVQEEIAAMFSRIKVDGGFGCISKNKKINDPAKEHKSCVKITLGYLLLLAELKLQGISIPCESQLVQYFTKRNIFYRMDDKKTIMVPVMAETFYPIDAIQIGVQNLVYALVILGQANSEAVTEGWYYMNRQRDEDGRYRLSKSKTIPAFEPGRKNKVNKWITLYARLINSIRNR